MIKKNYDVNESNHNSGLTDDLDDQIISRRNSLDSFKTTLRCLNFVPEVDYNTGVISYDDAHSSIKLNRNNSCIIISYLNMTQNLKSFTTNSIRADIPNKITVLY